MGSIKTSHLCRLQLYTAFEERLKVFLLCFFLSLCLPFSLVLQASALIWKAGGSRSRLMGWKTKQAVGFCFPLLHLGGLGVIAQA